LPCCRCGDGRGGAQMMLHWFQECNENVTCRIMRGIYTVGLSMNINLTRCL
jgi:hypothetical protein